MGESNTTNAARTNLHAWFGRAIFQPGARVVVCRTCNTFGDGPNKEKIPIVAVLTVSGHLEDNGTHHCELGGTRMDVIGPFFDYRDDGTIVADDDGQPLDNSPWLVCTCECVLYNMPPTDGGKG